LPSASGSEDRPPATSLSDVGAFTLRPSRCLKGMKSYTRAGVLVLADISGFTEFVTATELEHGPELIGALLEAVMRGLSPPREIQEVEGDAIFALGAEGAVVPPARLLDVLDGAFAAFKTRQRQGRTAIVICPRASTDVHRTFLRRSLTGSHGNTMNASNASSHVAARPTQALTLRTVRRPRRRVL